MPGNVSMNKKAGPLYQKLKDHIIERIDNGEWRPAHQIPSEHELVSLFKVSRMTANRALKELAQEGLLERIPGVGTFVAEAKAESHLFEIRNIADEVRHRGHTYTSKLLINNMVTATKEACNKMFLTPKSRVFHTVLVHMENHIPIQLEDRYVNPEVVPEYGKKDFTSQTPSKYLLEVAPLQKAEHVVTASMPSKRTMEQLHMDEGEPCLVLYRRTWSRDKIASVATLYHPSSRYQLTGYFKANYS